MNAKEILRWCSMVLSAAIGLCLLFEVATSFQKTFSLPSVVTTIAAAGVLAAPFFIVFHSCFYRRYDRIATVLVYVASTALVLTAVQFILFRFYPVRF